MTDTRDELIVTQVDGLVVLRLNRPERLNALSPDMLRHMESEVPRLVASSDVRAIMITGTGRAFCAGGDVGGMGGTANPEATQAGMKAAHIWLRTLRASEKLVITAVNGAAAGGGFGLAMIGDLIVASESAFFKAGFAELGAAADFGLAFTLPRAVGEVRATEILFSDRRVAAKEALAIGMISALLPADRFADDALEYAQHMARVSRGTQLTKRLLRTDEVAAFARFLDAEATTQAEAFQSHDFREGVAAFTEKRRPAFEGR